MREGGFDRLTDPTLIFSAINDQTRGGFRPATVSCELSAHRPWILMSFPFLSGEGERGRLSLPGLFRGNRTLGSRALPAPPFRLHALVSKSRDSVDAPSHKMGWWCCCPRSQTRSTSHGMQAAGGPSTAPPEASEPLRSPWVGVRHLCFFAPSSPGCGIAGGWGCIVGVYRDVRRSERALLSEPSSSTCRGPSVRIL